MNPCVTAYMIDHESLRAKGVSDRPRPYFLPCPKGCAVTSTCAVSAAKAAAGESVTSCMPMLPFATNAEKEIAGW